MDLPTIQDGEDKNSPFKNCLRNTYRHLRKWAKRTNTNCFRLYERDVKGFPVAIDYYAGNFCIHYFTPNREQSEPPASLQRTVEESLSDLFGASSEKIYWRTRHRREKSEQYEKTGNEKQFFPVIEYGVSFWVNLTDYLDTGLFLDHRETRHMVKNLSVGKRVLNLFAYTCSFSVHAALGGAVSTTSVDLSNTYCAWGKRNFLLNGLSLQNNRIIRADCTRFLQEALHKNEQYDLIVVDPPTISRSKKMEGMFDVQQDHIWLLSQALSLLSKGGTLIFSTNSRKFSLDKEAFVDFSYREITEKTIPIDFRNKKIHHCWQFRAK